jgi:hypothetical protein
VKNTSNRATTRYKNLVNIYTRSSLGSLLMRFIVSSFANLSASFVLFLLLSIYLSSLNAYIAAYILSAIFGTVTHLKNTYMQHLTWLSFSSFIAH